MMLLIGTAITVAFGASLGASLGLLPHELDFWWELAILVVIMLLGHWLEMPPRPDLLRARLPGRPPPDEAEKVEGEGTVSCRRRVVVDDVVVVRAGRARPGRWRGDRRRRRGG
jgi:Cu2+-exporting ATPase